MRQALAGRLQRSVGNAETGRILRAGGRERSDTLILRQVAARQPAGSRHNTPFGDYWVVPDGAAAHGRPGRGESITAAQFAVLQRAWEALSSNTGQVRIDDQEGIRGIYHGGFRPAVLAAFGRLLSRPAGRRLVLDLVNGPHLVVIQAWTGPMQEPADTTSSSGAQRTAGGAPGQGAGATIRLRPNLLTDQVFVHGNHGRRIESPLFITIGHELIHAWRNAQGRNEGSQPPTDPAYDNAEEEQTIAAGNLTENDLRHEHRLPARHGHQPFLEFPTIPRIRRPP